MKTIAIVNEKGGTGKTTTAVNLAAALGALGRRTLLIDLDGQAASSRWLGVEEDPRLADALLRGEGLEPLGEVLTNVSLAPASGKLDSVAHDLRPTQGGQLRKVLCRLDGRYDYVLIDCPPSLGNRLIGNALLAATHAIVPVEPSVLALDGLQALLTTLADVRDGFDHDIELIGVVACRYEARTRLSQLVLAELQRALPGKVFRTVIRETVRMRECPASGQSILDYAPKCTAAEDYLSLAEELIAGGPRAAEPAIEGDLIAQGGLDAEERCAVVSFREQATRVFRGKRGIPAAGREKPEQAEAETAPPAGPQDTAGAPGEDADERTGPTLAAAALPTEGAESIDEEPLVQTAAETHVAKPTAEAGTDECIADEPAAPPAGAAGVSDPAPPTEPEAEEAQDPEPPEAPSDEADALPIAVEADPCGRMWRLIGAGSAGLLLAGSLLLAWAMLRSAGASPQAASAGQVGARTHRSARPADPRRSQVAPAGVAAAASVTGAASRPAKADADAADVQKEGADALDKADKASAEGPQAAPPALGPPREVSGTAGASPTTQPGAGPAAVPAKPGSAHKAGGEPPPAGASGPEWRTAPPGFVVSAIMRGPAGYQACLNGEIVAVGDCIGSAAVVKISSRYVEMELDGARFTLAVGPRDNAAAAPSKSE
ncbi:MAG TPA: AAA family ATPase [Phycisphaerae bacterium]|nr:AAA family ATPase [Phycisphaerae bacterium]